MRQITALLLVLMLVAFNAAQVQGMWTCSGPATDMASCLECASQDFDDCIAWCEEVHQNFQGSYCRQDCLADYNAARNDCNDNFPPLWN